MQETCCPEIGMIQFGIPAQPIQITMLHNGKYISNSGCIHRKFASGYIHICVTGNGESTLEYFTEIFH